MSIDVGIEAVLDLTSEMKHHRELNDRKYKAVYQHKIDPLFVPLTAGAGTLDLPGQLGPVSGFCWSVRRLTLAGYTAGTATVYIDGLEPIPFPAAGMNTFGRGELLLHFGERLTIVASGITGNVQVFGAADVFETWYLPYYIG